MRLFFKFISDIYAKKHETSYLDFWDNLISLYARQRSVHTRTTGMLRMGISWCWISQVPRVRMVVVVNIEWPATSNINVVKAHTSTPFLNVALREWIEYNVPLLLPRQRDHELSPTRVTRRDIQIEFKKAFLAQPQVTFTRHHVTLACLLQVSWAPLLSPTGSRP